MLYIRDSRALWSRPSMPEGSRTIAVGSLLRELIRRIAELRALDRRVAWQVALAQLLLHEVREGAKAPHELIWPRDPRAARVAMLVQAAPADGRRLHELCRGQGVSARTAQRLFPLETGLTFENWRVRFRFLHASRLLAEGRKVSDVASSCGYRSPSAFVVAFTRQAGVTPGQFCRSSRQEASVTST
jgi:AraC-like DNA-binding protein